MGTINLYKIDEGKKQAFLESLSSKMESSRPIFISRTVDGADVEFGMTLYSSIPNDRKGIKWNWILRQFDKAEIQVDPFPSAVLLVEKNGEVAYAVTFGHAFFAVDKYADKDFGFDFARKVPFSEIKTTTLTTPNSKRNKMVNTYVDYNELEFDSGESFAKLKAKASLGKDFTLFRPSMEIGTSIRCTTESDSLDRIIAIICYIEQTIQNEEVKYKIPVFSKVKDKDFISSLNSRMEESVKENPNVRISELDIIGATEVFNHNDGEFILQKGRRTKHVTSLSSDELELFCQENDLVFGEVVLDILVHILYEGNTVNKVPVRDLIDYTDDEKKCLLSKGVWYHYNDDYLQYLADSIREIKTTYNSDYDFSSQVHHDYIESLLVTERSNDIHAGKSDEDIRELLKRKYYAERVFNELMARDYGFQCFDRKTTMVGRGAVEVMDLYKEGTMYAVKIGNSSSKLCFAVDQSLESLHLIKHKELDDMPEIHTVAIWLILERKTHIEENGVPNINSLNMLMLKNRLDHWKKEVRLQGYKPLICINYRT